MCRHLAYLGPPEALGALLYDAPHALSVQSRTPRHQRAGITNRDGFGVGWYDPAVRPEPARYRTTTPIWDDEDARSFAGLIRSGAVLAAARAASPGLPVEHSGNAPFMSGRWLFSHNGYVADFLEGAGAQLRARVSERRRGDIRGATDSEILFAIVLDLIDRGVPVEDALVETVGTVKEISGGRLNLLATDGARVAATAAGNSLFASVTGERTIIASEPLDDDQSWRAIPDLSVAHGNAASLVVETM